MNGYEILRELDKAIKEVLVVGNDWLPEEFRDNRTDSVSLMDLEKACDERDAVETEHQMEKREKANRIEAYALMVEKEEEIQYIEKA